MKFNHVVKTSKIFNRKNAKRAATAAAVVTTPLLAGAWMLVKRLRARSR